MAPHGSNFVFSLFLNCDRTASVVFDFFLMYRPEGGAKQSAENLGEFLTGDRIETSSYTIFMQHNVSCSALCKVGTIWGLCVECIIFVAPGSYNPKQFRGRPSLFSSFI